VLTEVEMRVVDPDRMREVERDAVDALAVSRDEVDTLLDRLLDANRAATAGELGLALKDVDGAQVERVSDTRYRVTFTAGGHSMRVVLEAASSRNPFGQNLFTGFRCTM